MKRILHVVSGSSNFTGIANYLYRQYMHMDHTQIRYDFFICKENPFQLVMDDPVFEDSEFYYAHARMKFAGATDYRKIARKLNEVLKNRHYDAVVVNTSVIPINYTCFRVAEKYKGVHCISHAHNSGVNIHRKSLRNKFEKLTKVFDDRMRTKVVEKAAALFSCTEEAGQKTFGKDAVVSEKFRLINNAIEVEKFAYRKEDADEVRRALGADASTFVIGNIGKLSKLKNQSFLIEVFERVCKAKPNSQLWLIGEGEDKALLQGLAAERKLEDKILFLGQKKDIERYYRAMDALVFPSLSEGLPLVVLEAQAAGLPTVISDGVTRDVMVTPLAEQVSLRESAEVWAERILTLYEKFPDHPDHSKEIARAGFSIDEECKKMAAFYMGL